MNIENTNIYMLVQVSNTEDKWVKIAQRFEEK